VPLSLHQLPLFPLQTVLCPGGWLPLRVFEVRYLDMVQRCHKAGAPFGVVHLKQGHEVASAPRTRSPDSEPAAEELENVGTLATIEALTQPQPGLLHIQCRGTQRFQICHTQKLRHGLWVADVELLPADLAVEITPDLRHTTRSLQSVVDTLTAQTPDPMQMPLQPPFHWNDAGWVANRWCELLPVPADLRQRLMALDNPLVRLELVSDILEQLRLDAER